MAIHFGTDGWRAVISDEFTFENVRKVAQAIADWVNEFNGHTPLKDPLQGTTMVVGFDTRFLSDRYAIEVARVLAANDITVHLTRADAPTPAVSFAVKHFGVQGGVMITASHNAPRYNGIKLKASYGGSASNEDCRRVEYHLERGVEVQSLDYETAQKRGLIHRFDPATAYNAHLETLVRRDVIASHPGCVVVDPMHGAGRDYIPEWLKGTGWQVTQIRGEMNPGFGGVHPEPIMPHLEALRAAVVKSGSPLGLATDGDADRTGAMDGTGRFIDPHRIFALALHYLVDKRGWRGTVVKTVSTTRMIDRLCERYGLPLVETPVGFNHIADLMMTQDVLIGGEESGGISIKGHIPEGDGILFGLLLLEIVAASGATLAELVDDLHADVGPAHYARRDIKLAHPVNKKEMTERLANEAPAHIAGVAVERVQSNDGVKYLMADGGWLLIRPSGTEPVLRVYAEAPEMQTVEALLAYGQSVAATA
jgi:alpha-D-glucose phosphate-specific phosphoglucomutase